MKQKRQFSLILIISVIVIICSLCLVPIIQLNHFYDVEARAVSKFDTLNSELFATIPVPNGVVELEQSSNGIISPSTEHGRYLRTEYQISGTRPIELLKYDVLKYYEEFFLPNGWKVSVSYKDFYTYSRGTACVDISFYGGNYSLSIWHDFWSQGFSPPDPNWRLLEFLEFGESTFANCPFSIDHSLFASDLSLNIAAAP